MNYYNEIKSYDLVSLKSPEENEERDESHYNSSIDFKNKNIKNIHNKAKDYR